MREGFEESNRKFDRIENKLDGMKEEGGKEAVRKVHEEVSQNFLSQQKRNEKDHLTQTEPVNTTKQGTQTETVRSFQTVHPAPEGFQGTLANRTEYIMYDKYGRVIPGIKERQTVINLPHLGRVMTFDPLDHADASNGLDETVGGWDPLDDEEEEEEEELEEEEDEKEEEAEEKDDNFIDLEH